MPQGTVKYVGSDCTWGFISRDDKQPKVFLHISEVQNAGCDEIVKGQRWAFGLRTGHDGRTSAIALKRID